MILVEFNVDWTIKVLKTSAIGSQSVLMSAKSQSTILYSLCISTKARSIHKAWSGSTQGLRLCLKTALTLGQTCVKFNEYRLKFTIKFPPAFAKVHTVIVILRFIVYICCKACLTAIIQWRKRWSRTLISIHIVFECVIGLCGWMLEKVSYPTRDSNCRSIKFGWIWGFYFFSAI